MMRQARFVMGLILVTLLISGCTMFDGIVGGGSGKDMAPNDRYIVSGTVTFHDTGMPLKATVKIGQKTHETGPNGTFSFEVAGGEYYNWYADTFAGSAYGQVAVNKNTILNIEVPPFIGWNRRRFNELAINTTANAVVRWKNGKVVYYWIETPHEDPLVLWDNYNLAVSIIEEYENILSPIVSFRKASARYQADLIFQWDTSASIDGYSGMCHRTWNSNYELTEAKVTISYTNADKPGLMRHELGHCIGLNHSSEQTFNMYPIITSQNQELTSVERNMIKLMYAIQPGTGPLSGAYGTTASVTYDRHEVSYNPDGTVTEVIYTLVND